MDEKIINDARSVGWSDSDISAAYATIGVPFPKVPVQSSTISSPNVSTLVPNTLVQSNIASTQNINPKNSTHSYRKIILSTVVILIVIAGGVYAYSAKLFSFFQNAPYSESNLVAGVLNKLSDVKSSTYSVVASLYVEPREADAMPFSIKTSDDLEVKEKYMRDYNRSEDVTSIINMLRYSNANVAFNNSSSSRRYPQSLVSAVHSSPTGDRINIKDPLTNELYQYDLNSTGDDFRLKVTFETPEAIEQINRYNNFGRDKKLEVVDEGNTITFTKTSSSYFSLSNKPPLNFFESMNQYAQYLPPEIYVDASVTAASNLISETNTADWKINLSGNGDFGDLSYKINVDALKKDKDYYLNISNIPSFFAGLLPKKGQWYKITPKETSTTTDPYSYDFSGTLAEGEKKYREMKQKNTDLIKKIAGLADEEKLFSINGSPRKETVGDRKLYKYELHVKKEAVLPFYKKLLSYSNEQQVGSSTGTSFLVNESFLRYLESPESAEVIEYYNKNTAVTVWVDDSGFLSALEYYVRVVPTEDAINMKDKQVIIKIKISFDDINENVKIDAPSGALDLENENAKSRAVLQEKSNSSSIISKISNIRAMAEIVYSKDGGYGTKAFSVGSCKKTVGTLFADPQIASIISDINTLASSTAVCSSSLSSGSVSSYAVSIRLPETPEYSHCIDSNGASKEILGSIKGSVCK